MKNFDKTAKNYRYIDARVRLERSLAFHAAMRRVGNSVKYLFSQPENLFKVAGKKMHRTSKARSDAKIVLKGCNP